MYDGCHLHEVGARTRYDTDVHFRVIYLAQRYNYLAEKVQYKVRFIERTFALKLVLKMAFDVFWGLYEQICKTLRMRLLRVFSLLMQYKWLCTATTSRL